MIKKNLIALVLITSLFACRSNKESTDKDTSSKPSVASTKPLQALMDEIKSKLSGCWMNKEYIDEIKRTKSPQQAYQYVGGTTALFIDSSKIKSDTLSALVNSGFHEGGRLTLKFDADIFKNGITIRDKEYQGLKLDKTGKLLTIYYYDEQSKSIHKDQFYKAATTNDVGKSDYFFINQILISGNYVATDSLKNSFKVSFMDNGTVTGLGDFKTYQIQADFMTPPNNLDEITFDIEKNRSWLGFKIVKDTISIYGLKDAADSVNQEFTNLRYKLVRQK